MSMDEQPVMWVGVKPGRKKPAFDAESETFSQTVRTACEKEGFVVENYLAAKGAFGSWFVQVSCGSDPLRLVWNGKLNTLEKQIPLRNGGWDVIDSRDLTAPADEKLTAAIHELLFTPGEA